MFVEIVGNFIKEKLDLINNIFIIMIVGNYLTADDVTAYIASV